MRWIKKTLETNQEFAVPCDRCGLVKGSSPRSKIQSTEPPPPAAVHARQITSRRLYYSQHFINAHFRGISDFSYALSTTSRWNRPSLLESGEGRDDLVKRRCHRNRFGKLRTWMRRYQKVGGVGGDECLREQKGREEDKKTKRQTYRSEKEREQGRSP